MRRQRNVLAYLETNTFPCSDYAAVVVSEGFFSHARTQCHCRKGTISLTNTLIGIFGFYPKDRFESQVRFGISAFVQGFSKTVISNVTHILISLASCVRLSVSLAKKEEHSVTILKRAVAALCIVPAFQTLEGRGFSNSHANGVGCAVVRDGNCQITYYGQGHALADPHSHIQNEGYADSREEEGPPTKWADALSLCTASDPLAKSFDTPFLTRATLPHLNGLVPIAQPRAFLFFVAACTELCQLFATKHFSWRPVPQGL